MKSVAFIPARAGSKGIPDKNIKPLCGKPLVIYTLQSALNSQVDEIVISTDCEKIYSICKNYVAAQFPDKLKRFDYHKRPKELSEDTSEIKDAVNDYYVGKQKNTGEKIIILQPTSPIRSVSHIDDVLKLLSAGYESVISVSEPSQKPQEMLVKKNDRYQWVMGDPSGKQRQRYEDAIYINGSIYGYQLDFYLNSKYMAIEKTYFYKMSQKYGLDIDTEEDVFLAEYLLSQERPVIF
jgi:CMP-N,N'-diacetyllegionaminic acid synthase